MNSISLLSTFCNHTNHSGMPLSLGTKVVATCLQERSSVFLFKSKRSSEKKILKKNLSTYFQHVLFFFQFDI